MFKLFANIHFRQRQLGNSRPPHESIAADIASTVVRLVVLVVIAEAHAQLLGSYL